MAEQDQRTEQATPRRYQKLREEGNVFSSHEAISSAVLVAVVATLAVMGERLVLETMQFSQWMFRLEHWKDPANALTRVLPVARMTLVPLGAACFAALAAGLSQTRIFSLSLANFKPERLDPSTHIKQVLPSKDTLLEIAKQFLKLFLIGTIVYKLVKDAMPRFAGLAATEVSVGAAAVAHTALQLAIYGGLALVLISGIDFLLAYRKYTDDAKMSREEIKDEMKEEEGNPQIRQRIRQRFRELIRRRSADTIKQATVLVTNPTHVSVALRYKPESDLAPILLSKGAAHIALQMRVNARRYGIPIVENRPLARALYFKGKEGHPIPATLYRAAAEVIVHVMRLKNPAWQAPPKVPSPSKGAAA
jgi:flagellar biosynthesis protein FlhB